MADKETTEKRHGCRGKAGPGRPKGVPNKATAATRDAFKALVEANHDKLQAALDDVYAKDKERWFNMMMSLSEYVLPKMARVEGAGPGGENLVDVRVSFVDSAPMLAHLVTSKFVDGLPIYRTCRQLQRQQVQLSPGTAGTWVNTIGSESVVPLINLMNDDLLAEGLVQMDETYLQVLRSEKSPSSDHYMVVRIAGPPQRRIVLFDYIPSRTTEALKSLLIGADGPFRGKLLTVGLELYDLVAEQLGIKHFGCAQHARTYFHKTLKVTELPSGRALARVAMEDYLGKVFKVERELKDLRSDRERVGGTLTPEEVRQRRRERSAPILTAFKQWLDDLLPGTTPQSALGKAISYTVRQWPKLVLHLEHGEVPIHNNAVENEIRPFSQGRRVWLFANNPLGATASANLFSLVSSARANGIEPYAYLNYVFQNLPAASTVEALEALLPWNVKSVLRIHCSAPA